MEWAGPGSTRLEGKVQPNRMGHGVARQGSRTWAVLGCGEGARLKGLEGERRGALTLGQRPPCKAG